MLAASAWMSTAAIVKAEHLLLYCLGLPFQYSSGACARWHSFLASLER